MNLILTNQSTQEKTIAEIALTQKVVIGDFKEVQKTAVMKTSPCNHTPSPPSTSDSSVSPNPPSPPTMAEVVRQARQPPAMQPPVASSQQQEPATHGILYNGSSLLYMSDSIFRNVYIEKIEKVTKSKVKVVKAYSSTYDNNKNKAKAISAKLWFSFSWPWFDLG